MEDKMAREYASGLFAASPDSAVVEAFVCGVKWAINVWIHEDELPEDYPYDLMFPFSRVDIVRVFPPYVFSKMYEYLMQLDTKLVTVCDKCKRASCWQGEHYCDENKTAGTVLMSIRDLRQLNRESPHYWVK